MYRIIRSIYIYMKFLREREEKKDDCDQGMMMTVRII